MGAVKMAMLMLLCVYLNAGLIERAAAAGSQSLVQGIPLTSGRELDAGEYRLVMQADCNLVLYQNAEPLWSTQTQGAGQDCFFGLQSDGNAVVISLFRGQETPVWSTNTCCRNDGDHVIVLQVDGNLVMYNGSGKPIWATGTNQ